MLSTNDFLDDGFKGTVVPYHFNFKRDPCFDVVFCLFTDPGCSLADDPLTHCRTLIGRQQGSHFVGKVIDWQKGFNFATNPLMQINSSP